MTRARYYPKADSVTQDFSTAYPGSAIVPDACLWHSTEGARWEPYGGGSSAPHFTVRIDPTRPRAAQWRQHFPLDRSSRALANAAGGVETNREHVIQVEIVATSGWASEENPSAPYKVALKVADLPDWFLRELGEFAAFLNVEWGIPLETVEFVAWNAKRPTMSEAQWLAAVGHIGHQHAPENDHTDPGELDTLRLLWHAQTFLIEWTAKGYPYAAAEPEPTPDPTPTPEPPPVVVEPPAPPPPPPTKDTVGETIRRGDRGAAIAEAQRRLTAHAYPATPDGIFGAGTETAARNFQDARGLTVDGVIGRDTWRELLEPSQAERDTEARAILTEMGWRVDTAARYAQAVKDYQGMCNLGTPLDVDGKVGPVTFAALRESRRLGGKISANFKASEFACKCGGRYATCRRIWASRALVRGAEAYRTIAGPFTPVSACRCWDHNRAVGGYSRSQHLHGQAMDVVARFSVAKVRALGVFPAIGYNAAAGTVRHVDFRNLSGDNYPYASGSTSSPYTYVYG